MPQDLIDHELIFFQIMAWWHQATKHYLMQCWPMSLMSCGVTGTQWVNSSPPSVACMHQWTGSALVQIMACRLFGAKPLPEPVLTYCQLVPWEQTSMNYNQNTKLFIHEYAFENVVCKMAAILFRGRWVKHCDSCDRIGNPDTGNGNIMIQTWTFLSSSKFNSCSQTLFISPL